MEGGWSDDNNDTNKKYNKRGGGIDRRALHIADITIIARPNESGSASKGPERRTCRDSRSRRGASVIAERRSPTDPVHLRSTRRPPYSGAIARADRTAHWALTEGRVVIFGITASSTRVDSRSRELSGDVRGEVSIDPDSLTWRRKLTEARARTGTISRRCLWGERGRSAVAVENSTASKWCRPWMKKNEPRVSFRSGKAICKLSPSRCRRLG